MIQLFPNLEMNFAICMENDNAESRNSVVYMINPSIFI